MKVTITLPDYPPAIYSPSWEAIEKLIRDDKGANYRAPGAYTFELNHDPESVGTIRTER